jgi:serine/threonine protein kinase/Tfp pilus assembly protein PilF
MVQKTVTASLEELDSFIEPYEAAQAGGSAVDLASFLPPREHQLYLEVLRELVRVDLEYGWRRGRPRRLQQYREQFPELFHDPEGLQQIAFEEYRLRRQVGDSPSPIEYQKTWGVSTQNWPVGPLGDASTADAGRSDHGAGSDRLTCLPADADFPGVGSEFLDFRVLAELGRGAFSRVYLAEQKGLAGRQVVLKIAASIIPETRMLARLQHTNIIPVYSVHHAGRVNALCMPYLGATTLADVLKHLRGRQSLPQSGKGLADSALERKKCAHAGSGPASQPASKIDDIPESAAVAWRQLERWTYVQAIVWLMSRIADGLAHAHERGILHRDLKPANILLTDDGQPMLLDFNLSEDTRLPTGAAAALIGGTLPYMAPEHLQAFQKIGTAVDARSDVYALGVIFFELLTGQNPFPRRTGPIDTILSQMVRDRLGAPPRLRGFNRSVSPAIESIVRHCLEPEPARRYQSARQLQEDLQRHMDNRPLRHAPERSLRERTAKWVRRHPRLSWAGVGFLAILIIAGLSFLLMLRNIQHATWEALAAYQEFRDDVQHARLLLATSRPADRDRLNEGLALAYRALDRYHVRDNSAWPHLPAVQRLPAEDQEQLRDETCDLLLLLASVTVWKSRPGDPGARAEGLRSALELNRLAETCYADGKIPAMVERQRATLGSLLDGSGKRAPAPLPSFAEAPRHKKDLCLFAQDLMNQGRFQEALPLWLRGVRENPRDLWTWAGLAACYDNLGHHEKSSACYSTCIALAPRLSLLYFKRGVAYLLIKNFAEARADFDKFLAGHPDVPEAYINRSLAYEGLKQDRPAMEDVTRAMELGTTQTRVYFIRALLRARNGDREGARLDREKGLRLEPADELSYVVRGTARINTDPKAALADFDRALQINSRSRDGLQNKASVLSEQLGQTAQSLDVLNTAIQLYPDFVPARAGRGVLLARLGKRLEAIHDAEECLRRDIQPATLYQVAGIYALTSKQNVEDRQEALFLLSSALRKGYGWNLIGIDTDLDPIRNCAEFRRLTMKDKNLPAGK